MSRNNRFKYVHQGKSMTHQSFAKDADINNIVKSYNKNGFYENVKLGTPVYADFTDFEDYHTTLNRVHEAQKLFQKLPSRLRAKVNNDPGQLMGFLEDESTTPEMLVDLGLVEPVSPEPVAVKELIQEVMEELTDPEKKTGPEPTEG